MTTDKDYNVIKIPSGQNLETFTIKPVAMDYKFSSDVLAETVQKYEAEIATLRAQVANVQKDAARYQAIVSMTSGRLRYLKLIQRSFGDQAFHEAIDTTILGSETK